MAFTRAELVKRLDNARLVVEGDETLAELDEAYHHLMATAKHVAQVITGRQAA